MGADLGATMAEKVLLTDCHLDYWTVTTFDWSASKWLDQKLIRLCQELGSEQTPENRRREKHGNYDGARAITEWGTYFHGTGNQKGDHYIHDITGALAHKSWLHVAAQLEGKGFRCTRIDNQKTMPMPAGWHTDKGQIRLLNRLLDAGKMAHNRMSKDSKWGKLETIYCGSTDSDFLVRVYEKVVGDELWLRYETQFRKDRSNEFCKRLLSVGVEWLEMSHMGSLTHVDDSKLTNVFKTDYTPDLPRVARADTNTERWLIEQVLPTFTRVISQHGESKVSDAFGDAILRVKGWHENDY